MRKVKWPRQPFSDIDGETGIALISVLVAMLLITALGLAITTLVILGNTLSTNQEEMKEALFIADSGIAHAKSILLSGGPVDYDSYLQAGNGVACDGDELSAPPPAPLAGGDEITSAAGGGHPFGSGRYEVEVCDDHLIESTTAEPPDLPDADPSHDANGSIRVISTGFGQNGAAATIEVLMSSTTLPAIVVEGHLRLNGDAIVSGEGGGVHANGNLHLDGVPCAEQYLSAVGFVVGGGMTGAGCASPPFMGADVPPDERPGEVAIAIPLLEPGAYLSDADYILKADGSVERDDGTVLKAPGPGPWGMWDWDPGNLIWKATGDPILEGIYYSEANIAVSGNPGAAAPPMPLTLIAEGWIDISGNPEIIPALTLAGAGYAMIAGTDLKVGGNPVNGYKGIFYAKDQLDVSGNPQFAGQLIAANQADLPYPNPMGINLVELKAGGIMEISGNPTIVNDEIDAVSVLGQSGWRECRGFDPLNPCQ